MKIWHGVFRLCVSSPRGTEAICDRSRTPISIKVQGWGEYLLHELTMLNINITAYGISKLPHMRMRTNEKAEGLPLLRLPVWVGSFRFSHGNMTAFLLRPFPNECIIG